MKKRLLWIPLLLIFLGCQKDLTELNQILDKDITFVNWEPTLVAPIINTKTTLGEMFGEIDTLVERLEEEQNVRIFINQDNLFTASFKDTVSSPRLNDFYAIPATNDNFEVIVPPSVLNSIGNLSVGSPIPSWDTTLFLVINASRNAQMEILELSSGNLEVGFSHNFNQDLELTVTLKKVTNKSTNSEVELFFDGQGTQREVLDNHRANLVNQNTNPTEFNTIEVFVQVGGTVTNNGLSGDRFSVDFGLDDYFIEFVSGFLGDFIAPIPLDSLELTLFEEIDLNNFSFNDPRVTFTPISTAGLDLILEARNIELFYNDRPNNTVNFTNRELVAFGVENRSDVPNNPRVSSGLQLNNTNSNIADLLTSEPDGVIYDLNVTQGDPMSRLPSEFFLTSLSQVDVEIEAELPLYFTARDYDYTDTFEVDLDVDTTQLEYFKRAAFKLVINNQLPLDLIVQAYLLDASGNVLDSLFQKGSQNILGNTSIDFSDGPGKGIARQAQDQITIIEQTKQQFRNTLMTDRVVFVGKASTSKTSSGMFEDVKILSTYEFGVRLGVLAEFDVDLNKEILGDTTSSN